MDKNLYNLPLYKLKKLTSFLSGDRNAFYESTSCDEID